MELEQLIDIDTLQQLLQKFYEISGIDTAIVTTEGTILTETGWQEICVKFHRVHPETAALCKQSDFRVNTAIQRGRKSVSYTCPMGLVDSYCPIIVHGRHLANIFTGQFFHKPLQQEDWARFRKQAGIFGFEEQQYLEAVAAVPVISRERHDSILSFLGTFAELIITMASDALALTEAKRRTEQREKVLKSTFELSPVLMTISEIDTGRYLQVNKKFTEMTGYSQDEVVGKVSTQLGILEPQQRRRLLGLLEENGYIEEQEVTLGKADGGQCVVSYSGCAIKIDGKKYLLAFGLDLSRRKEAEQENVQLSRQLRQAQKIEAIGTLAGGIAHDFNNILGAMLGYTAMALDDVQPDSRIGQDLQHVLDAGQRAKELVDQILTFSRQKETDKAILQPASVIKEAVKMLRSTLPSTISIDQEIEPEAGSVCADPVQLHQVVVNICTNAYHAMEVSGGRLVIGLRQAFHLPPQIRRKAECLGTEYVEISMQDTGSGMPPEVAAKIFDPFFTTKAEGKGTGMGLSIVHGIVSELEGAVTVDSEVGRGTTFRIFLPKTREISVEKSIASKSLPGGTESILFIDDEKMLVDMVRDKLERLGYSVVGETDSRAALYLFTSDPNAFDMVITDFTMPGMNGLDVAKRMLEVRPALPIIICTGYSELVDRESAVAAGIQGFLQKPVLNEDMAQLVRDLIDAGAATP